VECDSRAADVISVDAIGRLSRSAEKYLEELEGKGCSMDLLQGLNMAGAKILRKTAM
jgi:hypothetical protein